MLHSLLCESACILHWTKNLSRNKGFSHGGHLWSSSSGPPAPYTIQHKQIVSIKKKKERTKSKNLSSRQQRRTNYCCTKTPFTKWSEMHFPQNEFQWHFKKQMKTNKPVFQIREKKTEKKMKSSKESKGITIILLFLGLIVVSWFSIASLND